jgi:hypothetical protein
VKVYTENIKVMILVRVFSATFNNISVISWRLVVLVEETGVPEKNHDLLQVTVSLYGNGDFVY